MQPTANTWACVLAAVAAPEPWEAIGRTLQQAGLWAHCQSHAARSFLVQRVREATDPPAWTHLGPWTAEDRAWLCEEVATLQPPLHERLRRVATATTNPQLTAAERHQAAVRLYALLALAGSPWWRPDGTSRSDRQEHVPVALRTAVQQLTLWVTGQGGPGKTALPNRVAPAW